MITKSPSPRSWQKLFAPKILATYLVKQDSRLSKKRTAVLKGINKNVAPIYLLSLVVCAMVLSASGHGRGQNSEYKVELPTPTGKHAVGRTSFHWIDSSRFEEITDDPNDRRELMVTIWYPAESATGETAPYVDNLDKLAVVINQIMPTSFARSARAQSPELGSHQRNVVIQRWSSRRAMK